MKAYCFNALSTTIALFAVLSACAPPEKRMNYEEELQLKQFREEGLNRSPQEQRRYECAEWHKRHPGSNKFPDLLFETYQPPECTEQPREDSFDPMHREKKIDELIDQQLKEQTKK